MANNKHKGELWLKQHTPKLTAAQLKEMSADELRQTVIDIQERIADHHRVFNTVLESSFAGYWDWHIQDEYEYMSPSFKAMFGFTDSEVPNHPSWWQKQIHPDDLPGVFDLFEKHVKSKGKVPYDNEVRYYHKDGSIVWVYCRGEVIEWSDKGEPLRMIGAHVDITRLKKLQEKYQISLDSGKMGSWDFDIVENKIHWDDRLLDMYGMSKEDSDGGLTAWERALHPEDREFAKSELMRAIKGEKEYDISFRIYTQEGKLRQIRATGKVTRNAKGEPISMTGLNWDVTEQYQRQQLLELSLQTANIGIWDYDVVNNKLEWDDRMYQIYHVNEGEFESQYDAWVKRVYPADLPTAQKELNAAIDGLEDFNTEFRIVHPNGDVRLIRAVAFSVKDRDGKTLRMHGLNWDVTDERNTHFELALSRNQLFEYKENFTVVAEELQESETMLKKQAAILGRVLDAGATGYIYWDEELRTGECSELTMKLLGRVEKKLDFADITAVMCKDCRQEFKKHLIEAEKMNGEFGLNLMLHHNPLGFKYIEARTFPVVMEDGQKRLVTIWHDNTADTENETRLAKLVENLQQELDSRSEKDHAVVHTPKGEEVLGLDQLAAKLEESVAKLNESNQEMEYFTYAVSHDLRAPLRAIQGFSRILSRKAADKLDEEEQRYVNIIGESVNKMSNLIDHILQLSRLGRTELRKYEFDMRELIDEVLEVLLADHSYHPNITIQEKLPAVNGDRTMMTVVIQNILSNAIKYSSKEENPEISITATEDQDQVVYAVTDNGAGFDMKYADKVFQVFQRLHTEDQFPGSGVGMAMVKRVINRHAGEIWVESEVDKGTTVHFSLPK